MKSYSSNFLKFNPRLNFTLDNAFFQSKFHTVGEAAGRSKWFTTNIWLLANLRPDSICFALSAPANLTETARNCCLDFTPIFSSTVRTPAPHSFICLFCGPNFKMQFRSRLWASTKFTSDKFWFAHLRYVLFWNNNWAETTCSINSCYTTNESALRSRVFILELITIT